jgi:integrase/recombinase XerD
VNALDEVLATWRAWQEAQGLSERTIEDRAALVRRYVDFSHEEPLSFTPGGITRYVGRPGLKPRTRWVYRQHLQAYSDFLVRTHQRDTSPLVDVPTVRKPTGTPRPVETGELQAALEHAVGSARMMILLAAYAGLRVHEIAKFRGRDLDRRAGTITVLGKGGHEDVLPAFDAILAEAEHYPEVDWWFPAGDGGPVTRQAVAQSITRALRAAGVHATAHQLRHTFGTALLEAGTDVRVVMELMRHRSLQSTQIYTRVSPVQRTAAIGRLRLPGGGD